jgi:hypothetical protein
MKEEAPDFELFSSPLIGLPVSRVWQGYGSAIFVEFGKLHSTLARDGRPGSLRGEWTLFIEWSWRIANACRLLDPVASIEVATFHR